MIFKFSHIERSDVPSALNTSTSTGGVASLLANQAKNEPAFDGITINQMRNNPLYSKHDPIDTIGLAQREVIKSAKTIKSNTARIRQFNEAASRVKIPSKK